MQSLEQAPGQNEILKFLQKEEVMAAQKAELPFAYAHFPANVTADEIYKNLRGHENDTIHIYKEDENGNLHNGTVVRIFTAPEADSVERAHASHMASQELTKLKPRGIVFSRDRAEIPHEVFLHTGD